MAYTPLNWVDGVGPTPLSASNLNHIETGINDAHDAVDLKADASHNHDGTYSPLGHTHSYSALGHLHTTADIPTRWLVLKTSSYQLVLGDQGKLIQMSSTGPLDLTVPANADEAFTNGNYVDLLQMGIGQVTIVPGAGVTVHSIDTLKLTGQYAAATLTKLGTNEWILVGHLADT